MRILSAIGIDQLDSRATHENDNLQLTPYPSANLLCPTNQPLTKNTNSSQARRVFYPLPWRGEVGLVVGCAYKLSSPVLGEGGYVCRPRPKVGDPAGYCDIEFLKSAGFPCCAREWQLTIQLDSRATHENDNLQFSWIPSPTG